MPDKRIQPLIAHPEEPWVDLREILATGQAADLEIYIRGVSPADVARALTRLSDEERRDVFRMLDREQAADLLENFAEAHAADLIEELTPEQAAAIVGEMESDHRADILAEMARNEAEQVLRSMREEEAEDARRLLAYDENTAGGIMVTEFFLYPQTMTVGEVLEDVRKHAKEYGDFGVHYVYVRKGNSKVAGDGEETLVGVVRIRDLILSPADKTMSEIMIVNPICALGETSLDELDNLFEQYPFWNLPVTDPDGRMLGVVRRADMEEALGEEHERNLMRFSGIIGGEEIRNMPLKERASRRLAWLSLNVFLSLIAASVILLFEGTIDKIFALVFFIPVIGNMCGCSGNQAVAVSIRELALGLIQPGDFMVVWRKELAVGLINGTVIGLLLGAVAFLLDHFLWHDSAFLGLVIGIAFLLNTVVSVSLGGLIPLGLKRVGADSALGAPPILTTLSDMIGLLFVLTLAKAAITVGLI
jgi:magnesium transporter